MAALSSAEYDKKEKVFSGLSGLEGYFHPIVCVSVDGMMGHEATAFLQWIADLLTAKWEKRLWLGVGWICIRLSFAIFCATLVYLRVSHKVLLTLTG